MAFIFILHVQEFIVYCAPVLANGGIAKT